MAVAAAEEEAAGTGEFAEIDEVIGTVAGSAFLSTSCTADIGVQVFTGGVFNKTEGGQKSYQQTD